MGSNEREDQQQHHHHPPHISSLVVRTSGINDGEVGRLAVVGEVSRDRPSFSRSDRHKSENGHRTRASSTSPPRRPYEDQRHGSDLNNHSGARGREFSGRRESSGRYRDGAGGRRFDGPEPAHGSSFKGDGMSRNSSNSKVQPRDGDWYCLDPLCRNLNFARREVCFKCKRHRYSRANSPPPPRHLPLSPRRDFNGYRSSPPRGYLPPRLEHPTWRDRERDRVRYSDIEYPPSRRIAPDWVHPQPLPNPHFERRPPLSPPRVGRWGRHSRERSRSPPLRDGPPPHAMRGGQPLHPMRSRSPPLRDGPPPLGDYGRDSYFDRRGGRDRM